MVIELPDTALAVLLDHLDLKDLENLSLACSQMNTQIYSYLLDTCMKWKSGSLVGIYVPLIQVLEENVVTLNLVQKNLLSHLKKSYQLWCNFYKKAVVPKSTLYQMMSSRDWFLKHVDTDLSGRWDATYYQARNKGCFISLLLFDKVEKSIMGFSKDVEKKRLNGLHFGVIDGSYDLPDSTKFQSEQKHVKVSDLKKCRRKFNNGFNVPTLTNLQFEKTFKGKRTSLITYKGNLEDYNYYYKINGIYFDKMPFEMIKTKKIPYDSGKILSFGCHNL